MKATATPTEIARETLRLLAARKLLPTPENYLTIYEEVAGANHATFTPTHALQNLVHALPRNTARHIRLIDNLEKLLQDHRWQEISQHLGDILRTNTLQTDNKSWPPLLLELVKHWSLPHAGLTQKHKTHDLQKIFELSGDDALILYQNLQDMLHRWSEIPLARQPMSLVASDGSDTANHDKAREEDLAICGRLIQQLLKNGLAHQLDHAPALKQTALELSDKAALCKKPNDFMVLETALKSFWMKLAMEEQTHQALQEGLIRLLRLLVDNVAELLSDDQWLKSQLDLIRDMTNQPISLELIHHAEQSITEIIYKQGLLKHSLNEARSTMQNMLTMFIERLGALSTSTGEHNKKLDGYAKQIRQAEDIRKLNTLLDELLRETGSIQIDMLRSHEDLSSMRKRVDDADARIRSLESELEHIGEKVREDQLTSAFNRRGLASEFEREAARATRTGSALCLAMLDIDNFKNLNDTYGHKVGDDALLHLVAVMQSVLRPSDIIARYGGEEFVILLTDTPLKEGIKVITRVQRELTKKFFLHNNERMLITFSAGITLVDPFESQETTIERADQAMYEAKRMGKNRVVAAEPAEPKLKKR
ncbi:MAG: diguanylate cyclase [Proteobacteria bacterium]|nr:diguanylate cyclase [Pseudomonadota bacterium]MDE3208910.1 diguanylate cyclase [Pseudomonadota bacterium]